MAKKDDNNAIFQQLADIKANLASNSTETVNIKTSMGEIKVDIREIKNDFVNRREFNEGLTSIREEMAPIKRVVYGATAIALTALGTAIVAQVIK